jgi:hypothetical protein
VVVGFALAFESHRIKIVRKYYSGQFSQVPFMYVLSGQFWVWANILGSKDRQDDNYAEKIMQ